MKFFFPILFIFYWTAVTMFPHTHIINGVTITHSHPYNHSGHHSHTVTEFQLINVLSHFTTDGSLALPLVSGFIAILICYILTKTEKNITYRYLPVVSTRGPPSLT